MANDHHVSHLDYIAGSYMPFTGTKLLQSGQSVVHGVIINSNTTGSFRLYDGTSGAGTPIGGTFTPTTATSDVITFPKPLYFNTGIFIATGGTIDGTVVAS